MRTTLAIDDDVMAAAKAIAQHTDKTIGQVVSELARQALRPPSRLEERNGIPLIAVHRPETIVTSATINALRDALP